MIDSKNQPTPPPCPLASGDQVQEFLIQRLISSDELSHRYQAQDTMLEVPVILQEFHPLRLIEGRHTDLSLALSNEKGFQQALSVFIHSMRQRVKVSSPCGEKIIRYFEHGHTGFIVTEYFEGQELQALVRQQGRIGEHMLIDIFTPVLESLHAFHEAGVVHADLSPSSIQLRSNLAPILIGFAEKQRALITPTQYCAAELWKDDHAATVRSDIYSIGTMMYFCLSGLHVLSPQERLDAIKQGKPDPQPLAARLDGVEASPRLLTLIDHCLALQADRRPDSCALLLEAFQESTREAHGVRIEGSLSVKTKAQELSKKNPLEVTQLPFQEKDSVNKIVITGTAGSGKTSMIRLLCDEVFTPRQTEDIPNRLAADKMVRIDQGCAHLADGESLYFYGLPGPLGFESSWELVQRGTIGIILLLDNTRKDPQRDLLHFLSRFSGDTCPPILIGLTRTDLSRTPSIRDINSTVDMLADQFQQRPAVFTTDPAKPEQAWQLIETLLTMQLTDVQIRQHRTQNEQS